jgi:hypothetical protein
VTCVKRDEDVVAKDKKIENAGANSDSGDVNGVDVMNATTVTDKRERSMAMQS